MIEAMFECTTCGHRFVEMMLEPGEAVRKRIHAVPIRCPKCERDAKRIPWTR